MLAPRFSPSGDRVLYTSYESGFPRIYVLDIGSVQRRVLESAEGTMSFAPRFSPSGQTVVYSLTQGGNTDIYTMDIDCGPIRAPDQHARDRNRPQLFARMAARIVFESDRSGTQQLYVMPATGGEAQRISFGEGRYGTPVWSPRGDLSPSPSRTRDGSTLA